MLSKSSQRACVYLLLIGVSPAWAAEEPADTGALAEIVVTAQKRSENLQNVPITVSAVNAERLGAGGILNTADLVAVVPGLSLGLTTQNFQPHLRGIGTGSNGPGIENPVALYVDGVYYASQLLGLTDLGDVSQVTVIKGPQGTLFGRNATGGVIQMTTRDPNHEFGAQASTDLDNYLTSKNYVYATGGLSDSVATNLSMHYFTQGNGWGRNIADGDDIHKIFQDIGVRNKWIITPTDSTTIRINVDYSTLGNNLGPNLRPAPGTVPFLPGFTATSNPYDSDSYIDNRTYEKSGGGSVNLEQDVGFARLVSISAYRQYHFSTRFAPSATSEPGLDIPFLQDGKQATQELQLISPHNEKINWVAGAFYFYGHELADPFQIFLHGVYAPTPASLTQIDINDQETTRSVAGFAQSTAQILADTNLTLGLRYTHETREFSGTETGFVGPGIGIGPLIPFVDESISANKFTWRAALDHQFHPDLLGYVSYDRGFKSGGFNGFDPTNPPYQPEILDAYETGLKSEWLEHRLRANTSLFFYKYSDIQVTRYTNTAIVYNGASAKLYGIDFDAQARISSNFELNGGFEYLHSYFSSFPNAQFSTPLPGGGAAPYSGDATGKQLPYAPRMTIDISGDYHVDIASGRVNFNITDSYSSGYYTEADNRQRVQAYDYLNSSIAWIAPAKDWTIKLWARNLLDKAVPGQVASGFPQGYSADFTNPPRTYGVTVKYSFGSTRQ